VHGLLAKSMRHVFPAIPLDMYLRVDFDSVNPRDAEPRCFRIEISRSSYW